jgi:hypothetical protein
MEKYSNPKKFFDGKLKFIFILLIRKVKFHCVSSLCQVKAVLVFKSKSANLSNSNSNQIVKDKGKYQSVDNASSKSFQFNPTHYLS